MDFRCPLKLNSLPCQQCPLGENLFTTRLEKKHKRKKCNCKAPNIIDFKTLECGNCSFPVTTCHWGINSKDYNYCMWVYLSTDEGHVPITDTQIAEFIDLTVQRVGQIKNSAISFLHQIHGNSLSKYLIAQ